MKREQIIEFAKKHIYIEYKKAGFGTYQELGGLEEFADAILALPLDVPSDDIQTTPYNEALDQYLKEGINWSATANDVINCDRGNVEQLAADSFFAGAIWMRNEIIKRNK